jgi:hypothetical protein
MKADHYIFQFSVSLVTCHYHKPLDLPGLITYTCFLKLAQENVGAFTYL